MGSFTSCSTHLSSLLHSLTPQGLNTILLFQHTCSRGMLVLHLLCRNSLPIHSGFSMGFCLMGHILCRSLQSLHRWQMIPPERPRIYQMFSGSWWWILSLIIQLGCLDQLRLNLRFLRWLMMGNNSYLLWVRNNLRSTIIYKIFYRKGRWCNQEGV